MNQGPLDVPPRPPASTGAIAGRSAGLATGIGLAGGLGRIRRASRNPPRRRARRRGRRGRERASAGVAIASSIARAGTGRKARTGCGRGPVGVTKGRCPRTQATRPTRRTRAGTRHGLTRADAVAGGGPRRARSRPPRPPRSSAPVPYEDDGGFAKVDLHRRLRCGFPEVIFGQGKTAEQIEGILRVLLRHEQGGLVTRVDAGDRRAPAAGLPRGRAQPASAGPSGSAGPDDPGPKLGKVVVVTAGTSDLPVAEEARVTAEAWNCEVTLVADVGVAGLHRLLQPARRAGRGRRDRRGRRHGRGLAERRRRPGRLPGDRRADEHRLRGQLRRPGRAARDAQQLRLERGGRSTSTPASTAATSPA